MLRVITVHSTLSLIVCR